MFYRHNPSSGVNGIADAQDPPSFLLNLIDTPGHVDFSYEVSRSLAACQGALLVVDAAQGVQAQTVANFYLAFESNLSIIPVINKIDQPTADPDRVKAQLKSLFDLDPEDALLTSAKTGQGLEHVLPAVIERIPAPPGNCDSPLRMLLLDSYYDDYKGVICHVAVVDGALHKGDKITSAATSQVYEVKDVGIMHPELTPTAELFTGQVGYVVSGMRSTKEARVGDTLYHAKSTVVPLPGNFMQSTLRRNNFFLFLQLQCGSLIVCFSLIGSPVDVVINRYTLPIFLASKYQYSILALHTI